MKYNICCTDFILNASNIFLCLIGIGTIIMVHEFGHFIFCKIFGIPAPKFSIGVGPTIVKKIYKGTEFILALIPIGGYTQIGMDPEKKENDETDIFIKRPLIHGLFVMLAE